MKNKKWYVVIMLLSFSASIYLLTTGNREIGFYKMYVLPVTISTFSIGLDIIGRRLAEKDRLPHKLILPIAMSVPVIFAISQYGQYVFNQENENYTQEIIRVLVALIIIAVGNYLPKTKPSRFVGLKFFWLLDKPVLWFKVHRLAGYLWIISGVLMLSMRVSNKWFWVVSYATLLYVIPLIYSIVLLKREREEQYENIKN
ncbi:SdpI family protein [Streptococcus anginosus]|uniref:SdpI family protein n=1 Tax=Streptococcus anginosus TaxID=1328 RepID=UPI00066D9947|nr:SdpI family protein [Streptococcus anginosus]